jgi:hypothetical protein
VNSVLATILQVGLLWRLLISGIMFTPFNAASIFRSLDNGEIVRFGAYIDVQTWTSGTSNSFPVSIALHSPPVSISESHCAYTQNNETNVFSEKHCHEQKRLTATANNGNG